MKNEMPSQKWRKRQNSNAGIMNNEMASLLLDEKICFIKVTCIYGKQASD
jgi:hypothetical protein